MPSAGPNVAGTGASDNSFGSVPWTTPGNITASDNTRTSAMPATLNTEYLKATNFGFSVPASATILGIVFRFERQSSGGAVTDVRVRAVKGGSIQSTDLSVGATWTSGTDTFDSFGDATNLWGTTWTVSDINASNFGVVMSCTSGVGSALVDSVDCTVHYSLPAGGSPLGQTGFFGL